MVLFLLAHYGILSQRHHSSLSSQSTDTVTFFTSNFLLFSAWGGSLEYRLFQQYHLLGVQLYFLSHANLTHFLGKENNYDIS